MVNTLISAIVQVLVFTLIPFLFFIIKNKSAKGFLSYVGLKKSTKRANTLALLIMALLAIPLLLLMVTNIEFRSIMTNPKSTSGGIKQVGIGLEAIVTILIVALLRTSLSEEIFFRGFLAKRLIALTNFRTGNILQALIFGIIHTVLFLSITHNPLFLLVIFIFPTIAAYFQTYLNEKYANGSIVPGWIAHGIANVVAYSFVLFVL